MLAGRVIAGAGAVCLGVMLIAVVHLVPGYGRAGRGPWAQGMAARWILRALGVRVQTGGHPRRGPGLVVGNHVSFLDVLILAACAPMRMVAKDEIRAWPLVGPAARRSGALFLRRGEFRSLPGAVATMTSALRAGHRVQVFPEGTTRCGGALHPFRRAAFQAALDAAVVVVPVTVRYLDAAGGPTTSPAFLGDETVLRPVGRVLRMRGLSASVHWLPAIPAIPGTGRPATDRRVVARLAEQAIARDLGLPVIRRVRPVGPGHEPPAEGRPATPRRTDRPPIDGITSRNRW